MAHKTQHFRVIWKGAETTIATSSEPVDEFSFVFSTFSDAKKSLTVWFENFIRRSQDDSDKKERFRSGLRNLKNLRKSDLVS